MYYCLFNRQLLIRTTCRGNFSEEALSVLANWLAQFSIEAVSFFEAIARVIELALFGLGLVEQV
jgi:hypothetical protein